MTSTALDKVAQTGTSIDVSAADERRLAALYKQCASLAKSELVPKALRGKPDNVFALALYGEQYDLSPIHAVQRIYIIEGTFQPKGEVLAGVIMRAGHELNWDEVSDTKCSVSIRRHGSDRWQTTTYTIEQARRAGSLDVWVERKVKHPGDDWAKRETYVIGNDLGMDADKVKNAPDWAKKLIDDGMLKRKDPWFTHPDDMLAAKALRRAGNRVCPDALLGLEDGDPFVPLTPEKVMASTVEPDTDPEPDPDDHPDEQHPPSASPDEVIEDADVITDDDGGAARASDEDEPQLDPAAAHTAAVKRLMVTCGKAFPEADAPKGKKTHRQRLLRRAAQYAVVREHRSATDLTVEELGAVESWVHRHFLDDGTTIRMGYEILDDDVVRFTLGDKSKDIEPAADQPAAA